MKDELNHSELELIKSIFEEYGKIFKFSVGQLLCTEKYLPGNIYFIKEGKARLITNMGYLISNLNAWTHSSNFIDPKNIRTYKKI